MQKSSPELKATIAEMKLKMEKLKNLPAVGPEVVEVLRSLTKLTKTLQRKEG